MGRRRFLGSRDPNAIILKGLFPLSRLKVSTELKEKVRPFDSDFQEFVFEGEEEHLRFIETNSRPLEETGWRLGDPISEGDSELRIFRRLKGDFSEFIEVPVFRGWHELSKHFLLANRVRLVVQRHHLRILDVTCDLVEETKPSTTPRIKVLDRVLSEDELKKLN